MNPVKPTWKSEWLPLLLIIVSFGLGFYFYAHFPASVPSHWGINGEVNGHSSKAFGAFFLPILVTGLYLLFLALPYIDPKKDHYASFDKAYHGIKNIFVAFMFALYIFTGLAGLGYNIAVGSVLPIGVGLLFIGIGYFIKSVKQNWWMGVRTPWTMESPVVWQKTNALMAKLMMVGGLLIALCSLAIPNDYKIGLFVVAIIIIAIVPIVYSYFIYQAEQKDKK
jgi:uncharacterized membrane protein